MGLIAGSMIFKKTVKSWITPPTGMIYRAAKEAYEASMADQVVFHQGKLLGGNGQLAFLQKYNKRAFLKITKTLAEAATELVKESGKNIGKLSGVTEIADAIKGFGQGGDKRSAAQSLIIGINKLRKTGVGLYKSGKDAYDEASVEVSAANIEGVGSSNNSKNSDNNVGGKTTWGVVKKGITDTVVPGASKAIRSKTGASQAWGGTVSKIAPALIAVVKQQDAQDLIDVGDTLARLIESQKSMDKIKKEKSEAFAKAFCDSLEKSLFPDKLANAISKYIKSMDMTLTTAVTPPACTMANAGGPVVGVLTISTTLPTTKLVIY